MSRWLTNVFRLGLKELSSLSRDLVMMGAPLHLHAGGIYTVATGVRDRCGERRRRGDRRRRFRTVAPPARCAAAAPLQDAASGSTAAWSDAMMDRGDVTFVLDLPPRWRPISGRTASRPSSCWSTRPRPVTQAGSGPGIRISSRRNTLDFLESRGAASDCRPKVVSRVYFSPSLDSRLVPTRCRSWENVTILSMILVGAAVIRSAGAAPSSTCWSYR